MYSPSVILSIKEMIDEAFGDPDVNIVNFKLIQTILYILARQLRILERQVSIELGPSIIPVSSSLSITEVKLQAQVKRKKRTRKIIKGESIVKDHAETSGASRGVPSKLSKITSKKDSESKVSISSIDKIKSSADKTTSDDTKTSSSITKSSTTKTSTAKSSSDKTRTTSEETKSSSETTKSTSDKTKTTLDETETKSSSQKTSTLNESTKTSSDKTKSSSVKTSSDKTSSDKMTSDKSSSDKISSDKTSTDKTSSDKMSSDKTSSDKTTSEKTSSDKTSSYKTSSYKTSSDKTSSDKTSTDKTSTDKTSSDKRSSEKTTSDKTSSDKTSSDKTFSDKTPLDKISSRKTTSEKTYLEKSVPDKPPSEKRSQKKFHQFLEEIEQQRERELRVIHQRADSREEAEKSPSPMASMDSVEMQYEKLLIVERLPAEEAAARTIGGAHGEKTARLSIVTKEQFDELASIVKEIQTRFGAVGKAEFPENLELMKEIRKGASLTDAMAALQLSARMEAAEKTLANMMSLVTDLAGRKGIDISELVEAPKGGPETKVIFKAPVSEKPSQAIKKRRKPTDKQQDGDEYEEVLVSTIALALPEPETQRSVHEMKRPETKTDSAAESTIQPVWITIEELDDAMEQVYENLLKTVTNSTNKAVSNADTAMKMALRLEKQLDSALHLRGRMDDLEAAVSVYAEQINVLDTGLSSQMTSYQEQLTQMQHDLEAALEAMAEALANIGGDPVAVAELNANFTSLQGDIESTNMNQKELRENQDTFALDLQALWKEIEMLREVKSDRDEVADALRDKAGLGELNGLVAQEQFNAVRGDFEKRICSAYDKFNNQELVWQKAIDEILRIINEKADYIQVVSLRDDINKHLENLRRKIHDMMEIVGEPRSSAVSKKLFRDTDCLACATPAHLEVKEGTQVPALPAFTKAKDKAEKTDADTKVRGDGDHGICYPGKPIPHPLDPRAHVCRRYCGGSHTLLTSAVSRTPVGMTVTPVTRQTTTEIGTDGKTYLVDATPREPIPCRPCNIPKEETVQPLGETYGTTKVSSSGSVPEDMLHQLSFMKQCKAESAISETPPPPPDE